MNGYDPQQQPSRAGSTVIENSSPADAGLAFTSLVQLFDAQVDRHPDRVAVSGGSEQLTYRQLRIQSEHLARRLRKLGVGPETMAGVCLERSPRYVVALLAILKAGGAFLPMDPRYPRARLRFMLEDSRLPVLITESRLLERVGSHPPATVLLDGEPEDTDAEAIDENAAPATTPESLAYVIYTSGSTGKPKGVLCPQAGLMNRLTWMWEAFPFEAGERCCQIVSLSFVDSIYEIFGPLLGGIELVVIPDEVVRGSPLELVRALERAAISRMILVPSVLANLLDCIASGDVGLSHLKYVYVSGEALPLPLAKRFREILPHTRLINFYGASELSHHATYFEVGDLEAAEGADAAQRKTIPIGRPIPNTQAYVLDAEMREVPDGVVGELYMGGIGLSRGYLNRPELTDERFIHNPFELGGPRLFKTGDLCRRLSDGNLEYLGRADRQVKIRGHRIEPAEVEAALKEHPGVRETVVTTRESQRGEQQLVAWVIARQAGTLSGGDLRRFLLQTLPDYLVPSHFMFVPVFPRLPNGKVNRRELAAQVFAENGEKRPFAEPISAVERRLQVIWQQVLETGSVGRDDDFFDRGGDSLRAARALATIEEQFGVNLPAAMLFEAATIAQFAGLLEGERATAYPRYILPIQPLGSGTRFFCFGAGVHFRPLAQELGEDQPLFGVTLDQRDLEWLTNATSLEEVVRRMIESIRSFQPKGPYYLGGHSMHGLHAYEAARQLLDAGEEVAVVLLDTHLPGPIRENHPVSMLAKEHVASMWAQLREGDMTGFLRHVGKMVSFFRTRFLGPTSAAFDPENNSKGPVWDILVAVKAAYSPQILSRPVLFLEAKDQPLGTRTGARFGWDRFSNGRFEIRTVPGDHLSMLVPPHVHGLAEELRTFLKPI